MLTFIGTRLHFECNKLNFSALRLVATIVALLICDATVVSKAQKSALTQLSNGVRRTMRFE